MLQFQGRAEPRGAVAPFREVLMKVKVQMMLAAAVGCAVVGATTLGLAAQSKSIWDGVYTAEQATKGKTAYVDNCSTCHLEDMSGGGDGIAPSLTGDGFMKAWDGKTMAELFEKVQMMPPGMEASVTDAQRADILAYVLSYNKVPPGQMALAHEAGALKSITFKATK
ncbi:MAG: cytochrome c [Vicinamibacterales bacterium]